MKKKLQFIFFLSLIIFISVGVFLIKFRNSEIETKNAFENGAVTASEPKDKWSLSEWLEAFPEEIEKTNEFQKLVQMAGQPETFSTADTVNIAVVFPGIQESDYWERSVVALEARLLEIELPYILDRYFSKPGETEVQRDQIKEVIESEYEYLITTLDESSDMKTIERIITTGKTKVILQNITTPLRRFTNHQPFLYTGFDHEVGAALLADEYCKKFPNGGNWILLLFTDGLVSEQRGGGFRRALENCKGMDLHSAYLTEGRREKSKDAVLNAFSGGDSIDFIYSCATDVTVGALEALESMGKSDSVFLNGWGGGSLELELIQDGKLDITVMRMNDDAAVAMAEAIKLDIVGNGNMVPLVYSGKFEIVDQSNSEKIEALKNQAFRYSGK